MEFRMEFENIKAHVRLLTQNGQALLCPYIDEHHTYIINLMIKSHLEDLKNG